MTGMTADLVRHVVAQHDDIEIVDSVADVDVVITMYPRQRAELRHVDLVLAAKPGLRALAVEDRGRTAVMYALVPETTELGPLSADTLVEFIRTLPRPDPCRGLG
jgi:hypothetical protein